MNQFLGKETIVCFHKGIELPATVQFFWTKEEPVTAYCPGCPEDFEITSIVIAKEYEDPSLKLRYFENPRYIFNFAEVLFEEFGEEIDVCRFCDWADGLEESITKAFYNHIEKKTEEMKDE